MVLSWPNDAEAATAVEFNRFVSSNVVIGFDCASSYAGRLTKPEWLKRT